MRLALGEIVMMLADSRWPLAASLVLTAFMRPSAALQKEPVYFYMQFSNAKTHAPDGGADGKKTARMTVEVRIVGSKAPASALHGVDYHLGDLKGKRIPAAKVVASPVRKKQTPKGADPVVEFDAAVYSYAPKPGDRYMLYGKLPSGEKFGKAVRFTKSDVPLSEEPWEKAGGKRKGK
jgi:hypothetical protein